ncbi:glycosyltransferase family 4 protein [Propionivibrio sp.]|uniref:glycosyltransferase family 4 protein n=1 Tax=Propionivibrio sp. TaxID=2212460 RepID=UPI0039E60731
MRIAYVTETYPPEINGVALTVERTVGFLRARGHDVDLIRPQQRGETRRPDREEWLTAGIPLPMYPELRCGLALPATVARRFARQAPDLVHIATEGPLGWAALSAARRLGLPATTDFRTNFHTYSKYYRLGWLQPVIARYLRIFHNRATRTFVPTRLAQRALAESGFHRLEVAGRGVDTALFSPKRRSPGLREAWGAAAGEPPVLLYVGRLAREKRVDLALRAFDAARAAVPAACMIVVGDGPQRRELEARFPAARFVGQRRGEDLARHYASADLFVFPSESETFGNVTLEALASGLAVVGFRSAAVAELVAHGDNGFAVEPGDDPAFIATLAAACRRAAAPDGGLAAMRRQARLTALAADWNTALGHFEKCLLRAVAGFPERRRRVALA